MLRFKSWRKSPALTQETTPSQRRITRILSEAQQAAAAEFDALLPRVADLLSRGRVGEVSNMVPMNPWVDVQEPLAYELLGELLDAGSRVRLPTIEKASEVQFSFDRGRPESAQWAWREAGELVVQITQEQREVVQQIVALAASGTTATPYGGIPFPGQTPIDWTQVARTVRGTIGLTAQQAGWVANHYDRAYTAAIQGGAGSARAAALAARSADRYQTSVHRYRANTIARTETMRAASEGRMQAWNQGMAQGFIDPLWQKEWIAESDACPICMSIDGKRIGVKDSFPVGEPPAHPNCRCDVLLVPPKPQPQGTSPLGALGDLETGFDLGRLPGQLLGGPPSMSTPTPDRPGPTFIGMPSGVFIGMPKVVTFSTLIDDAEAILSVGNQATSGDGVLAELYARRGFDGMPTVLSEADFDLLYGEGAEILYRGISGPAAARHLDDLRGGDYYAGLGVYGNGTYASIAFDDAWTYAGGSSSTTVRMALMPGSNVIRYDDLRREWIAYLQSEEYLALMRLGTAEDLARAQAQGNLLNDIGRYAVARGYDAIDVGQNYWVILNRSRVRISATNGLGPTHIHSRDLEEGWYALIRNDPMMASTYPGGMNEWAWDQGYRYVHTQYGRVLPLNQPDN